ncbi:RimJ/RimL family protein N-acetyltransferase [Tamaricihabitans halophyticus]|uniref:RimJ/RimL family protein N-acetyltransferase n=2 Tax=Tamaricihabitans halophyticus TaxID=1262583 RepID=A0A4R2QUI1_9PSEU|nr:RimJ/RimL family protein N-acetyltransferase [Tamaricihabitans halophyticus]
MAVRPASAQEDAPLVRDWLNAEHAKNFWRLHTDRDGEGAYSVAVVREYLRAFAENRGESAWIGELDGAPASYWETYEVASSPLAGEPELSDRDRGIHVLIGSTRYVGRGLGPRLLAAMAAWQFAEYPVAARVVAEPDVRNERAVRAFQRAGFRQARTVDLERKRAALMIHDRRPPTQEPQDP